MVYLTIIFNNSYTQGYINFGKCFFKVTIVIYFLRLLNCNKFISCDSHKHFLNINWSAYDAFMSHATFSIFSD